MTASLCGQERGTFTHLSGPKQKDGEEIGARDTGYDERQAQDPWSLLQPGWKYRMSGAVDFPASESNKEDETENKWSKYMGCFPVILVTSPLR